MSKKKRKIIFSNKNIKEDYICKVGESEGVLLRKVAAHKWWKERVNGGGCDSVGKDSTNTKR